MSDAAQIIAAHRWKALGWECACGDTTVTVEGWPAHVLAVLSETHAVVELPEPEAESYGWDGERHNVVCDNGLIEVDVSVVDPVEARQLAAHLLAAARMASS